MGEEAVRAAFAEQAHWCTILGAPFTARLVKAIGERIDRGTPIGRRILDWPGDPSPSADHLPARVTGALHYLVRTGAAPALAALYPPAPLPGEDALWSEIAALLGTGEEILNAFLDNPPQTNEVGRSGPLISGMLVAAHLFGLPLRLFELGASGGLNLVLDRYGYDLGGLRTGDPTSRLQLAPAWQGEPPPDANLGILSRQGVDLRPIDVAREGERLLAFVWPDQQERLARLQSALAVAAADPPPVAQGDAADWLERILPEAPREGAIRLVFHSIAFQYFPAATRHRIETLMDRLGADADAVAALAWLRCEQAPGDAEATLRLRTWPGDDRLLAWAHPHGARVRWVGR